MATATTTYGYDTGCLDDIPLVSVTETDPRIVIGHRLARRLQTPRGALGFINGNPDGGYDVRQLVNGKLTPTTIAAAQVTIQNECEKDEEIQSAQCQVVMGAGGAVSINIQAQSAAGPFAMVLTVDQLTAAAVFSLGQ